MKKVAARQTQLEVERLERRETPASISFPDANGVVTIFGTNSSDIVTVNPKSTTILIYGSWGGYLEASKASVKKIVFYGFGGSDSFVNNTNLPSTVHGGAGKDYLYGGDGNDVFYGGGGNDILDGRGGNDDLYGDGDNDYLCGGSGNDDLYGGGGTDELDGGEGGDYLDGGDDGLVDALWGGYHSDVFRTHFFEDTVKDKTWVDVVLV